MTALEGRIVPLLPSLCFLGRALTTQSSSSFQMVHDPRIVFQQGERQEGIVRERHWLRAVRVDRENGLLRRRAFRPGVTV
jgi:hypothetical protein